MVKSDVEKAIEVMQAWLDGKSIEYCGLIDEEWKHVSIPKWKHVSIPKWDWNRNTYRVKEEFEFKPGTRFKLDGDEYILATVHYQSEKTMWALIGLKTGNRWSDPINRSLNFLNLKDIKELTKNVSKVQFLDTDKTWKQL